LIHDVRHIINDLWDKLPEELRATREAKYLYEFGCATTMDIVELIYRPAEAQGSSKDYEFSRATMRARWREGLSDAQTTFWLRRGSRPCRRRSARASSTCSRDLKTLL
jgi:NTE family protein